jgi:hypothetical protein
MIVAEVHLTEGGFGDHGFVHIIRFDDLAKATAEYARVADLMTKKSERGNDLPKLIEVEGAHNKVSLPLDHLRSVGLADFAKGNEQEAGVRDAFPNLFKR